MKKIFLKTKGMLPVMLAAGMMLGACCREAKPVSSIEATLMPVDSTLDAIQDSDYLAFLVPLQEQMEAQLNIPLGYAPEAMTVGQPESSLLNWSSDALQFMADSVYDGRVDFAVVNEGGIRCDWPAGDITYRSVFEMMPFDNELVILTLPGTEVLNLAQNCVDLGGQGVSAAFRVVGGEENGKRVVKSVTLNGQPIDPDADYYVATSDYLSGGADGLNALTQYTDRVMTGKKIRDLYIDYIKYLTDHGQKVESAVDGRMQPEGGK